MGPCSINVCRPGVITLHITTGETRHYAHTALGHNNDDDGDNDDGIAASPACTGKQHTYGVMTAVLSVARFKVH